MKRVRKFYQAAIIELLALTGFLVLMGAQTGALSTARDLLQLPGAAPSRTSPTPERLVETESVRESIPIR